mmetsp:Transcript_45906/g.116589  ORF Transcript_45906/g.116589 Transcript_45906/m.116589 type:complete len:285 (-) Transcript_45906:276-1130(-)
MSSINCMPLLSAHRRNSSPRRYCATTPSITSTCRFFCAAPVCSSCVSRRVLLHAPAPSSVHAVNIEHLLGRCTSKVHHDRRYFMTDHIVQPLHNFTIILLELLSTTSGRMLALQGNTHHRTHSPAPSGMSRAIPWPATATSRGPPRNTAGRCAPGTRASAHTRCTSPHRTRARARYRARAAAPAPERLLELFALVLLRALHEPGGLLGLLVGLARGRPVQRILLDVDAVLHRHACIRLADGPALHVTTADADGHLHDAGHCALVHGVAALLTPEPLVATAAPLP